MENQHSKQYLRREFSNHHRPERVWNNKKKIFLKDIWMQLLKRFANI